jgi:hypothetical protein
MSKDAKSATPVSLGVALKKAELGLLGVQCVLSDLNDTGKSGRIAHGNVGHDLTI